MIRSLLHPVFCKGGAHRDTGMSAWDAYHGGWKYYCMRCGHGWGRFR